MKDTINQIETLEATLKSGHHPEEMTYHMQEKYRELDAKLNNIAKNINVLFEIL